MATPPKEMAADVGYPIRGGQTLLIAYFPWEASEEDIEREFAKFSRVKRVHLVVPGTSISCCAITRPVM